MKKSLLLLPLLALLGCGEPNVDNPVITIEGGKVQGVF